MRTQDHIDAEDFVRYFKTQKDMIGSKLVDIRISEGGAYIQYWFEGGWHHDWPMENYKEVFERARQQEKENTKR